MANTSKTITCSREFQDGTTCTRPVNPVFGAYPEECTSCATRVLATKDGFEAAERIIEEHYGRLRALVIAADIKTNPWAVKDLKPRFQMLDKLASELGTRRTMRRMSVARMLDNTSEPRRTSLGHMWRTVTPERAIELRKGGFETRYIGVAWQVKVS